MDKLANQLSDVLEKLKDPGLEAARHAVRLDAMQAIAASCVWLTIACGLLAFSRYVFRNRPFDGPDQHKLLDTFDGFWTIVSALLACVIIILCFLVVFVNPWTWAAFTNPDAIIAHKILRL